MRLLILFAAVSGAITTLCSPSHAQFNITKTPNPTTYSATGQTITYTYVITAVGDNYFGISVTDNKIGTVTCPATTLNSGVSMTCTANYVIAAADIGAASVTNTVTVRGFSTDDPGQTTPLISTQTATITNSAQASWTLSKSASPTTYTAAGQSIAYSYLLTNTGNVSISAIALTDNKLAPVTCPATTLAPGASMTCTGAYTTTAADVAAGSVTNIATATGTPTLGTLAPVTAQATIRSPQNAGSITIVKSAVGGNQTFNFGSSNPSVGIFSLTTTGGSATRTFAGLAPGTYAFTEINLPPSWQLSSLTCSGDTGGTPTVVNLGARTATIGLDSGEAITCTFTNTFDRGLHIQQTQGVIRGFLSRRIGLLASDEPDRPRLLRRLPGSLWGEIGTASVATAYDTPITLSGSGGEGFGRASVSTSLAQAEGYRRSQEARALNAAGSTSGTFAPEPRRFDAWIEAHFNAFNADKGGLENRGRFNILYAGADYLLNRAVLVGALVQVDWMSESSRALNTSADGTGFLAGPYLSARLTPNVFFDVRAAWGTSSNRVNPFNVYQDKFATERWLTQAKFTGNWWSGHFRITPSASITYVEESQRAYTDMLGVAIPSQTVSLGRFAVGPEFAYRVITASGITYEPHVRISGVWNFHRADAAAVGGFLAGTDVLRAQAQAGVLVRSLESYNLRAVAQYEGIGSSRLSSYGGQIWLNVPFRVPPR